VKFLAAEAMRGCGAVLLNGHGDRFADELGRRDYVSGEILKCKGPHRLIMNTKSSKEIQYHVDHYGARGLMKKFNSGADLAKELGVSSDYLKNTFEMYNKDCAAGKPDRFGKRFFKNWPYNIEDSFNVCEITPVIHYTMGGIKTNHLSEIEGPNGPIPGLYGAGEIMGGVHGKNRLGGNSLLDCVVYGRVAGREVMKYMAGASSSPTSGGLLKKYTMEEVAKHNT
jgi:succinate dehydrogenase/fumarate reductase flavoprotein subunit